MLGTGSKVAEYRGGKDKLWGIFVGPVMKASSGGKANPTPLNDGLNAKLVSGRAPKIFRILARRSAAKRRAAPSSQKEFPQAGSDICLCIWVIVGT